MTTDKITWQVTSLETSMELKALGVKQDSAFYWVQYPNEEYYLKDYDTTKNPSICWDDISAFTASEIGRMLPYEMSIPHKASDDYWQYDEAIHSIKGDSFDPCFVEENEVECRAKLLVFLIKNKLIEVPR